MNANINSRGLERKDNKPTELEKYFAYRDAVNAIGPVNSEAKAQQYRDVLKEHCGIEIYPADDGFGVK